MACKGGLLGVVVVALLPFVASAATQDATIERCGKIEDAGERLACYDRVATRAEPATAEQPQLIEETVGEGAEAAQPARPAPVAETAEKTERPPRWRRWFKRAERQPGGDEGGDSAGRDEEAVAQRDTTTAEIVAVKELMRGNVQITLDGGEVWRENEYEPNTTYATGDRVTIRPAPMGTHTVYNERTRQSVRMRRVR